MLSRRKFFGGSLAGAAAGLWPFKIPPKAGPELSPVVTEYTVGGWEFAYESAFEEKYAHVRHMQSHPFAYESAFGEKYALYAMQSHPLRKEETLYDKQSYIVADYHNGRWIRRGENNEFVHTRYLIDAEDLKELPRPKHLPTSRRSSRKYLHTYCLIPLSMLPRTAANWRQRLSQHCAAMLGKTGPV